MARVAVVGGGIAGLAAAHRLHELQPAIDLTLFEASDQLGGILQTVEADGYLIERGADSFITNLPWGVDLCRRVGLADELIPTDERRRQALVVSRGQLQPVPEGFLLMAPNQIRPILGTPILSWRGKARLAWEALVPARHAGPEESLATFARRRLGREVFERLVQPLVAGIYSADPERLSLAATMPRFLDMERKHGSLIRAAWSERKGKQDLHSSGARYSQFVTPKNGLRSLVDAVARCLPAGAIRRQTRVESITPSQPAGWTLRLAGHPEPLKFDALVLAASAPVIGSLLQTVDQPLAEEVLAIEHAGATIVCLGYSESQCQRPLQGFGFVVPAVEKRAILSASYSSNKFPGRAPPSKVLIRAFFGGALQPELVERSDRELTELAMRELQDLAGVTGPPELVQVARWRNVMPQYHLGHLERVERIERQLEGWPTLAIAGNAWHGVGIPQVIHSGEQAAERILQGIGAATPGDQ